MTLQVLRAGQQHLRDEMVVSLKAVLLDLVGTTYTTLALQVHAGGPRPPGHSRGSLPRGPR